MKVGISTYALTWSIGVPQYEKPKIPLSAESLLELAKSLNVDIVQFADNLPLHEFSDSALRSLANQAKRMSLTIELGTRGTKFANLVQYLNIAEQLGAQLVRTIIENTTLQLAIIEIKSVIPLFERAGIKLAIENHGGQTSHDLSQLILNINSPILGCCLDTVNSFGALEGSIHVIPTLLPLATNIHIKDFKIERLGHQMGFLITGTPAGKGMLDIRFIASQAKQLGHDPNLILELWVPFEHSVEKTIAVEREWLKESVEFLRNIIV